LCWKRLKQLPTHCPGSSRADVPGLQASSWHSNPGVHTSSCTSIPSTRDACTFVCASQKSESILHKPRSSRFRLHALTALYNKTTDTLRTCHSFKSSRHPSTHAQIAVHETWFSGGFRYLGVGCLRHKLRLEATAK